MLACGLHQVVIAEKPHQGLGREIHDLFFGGGPDRARDRRQVVVTEPAAHLHLVHQLAQRDGGIGRDLFRPGIEAQQITHHAQESGIGQIALLGKQRRKAAQPIFDPATADGGGKAHIRFRHRHIEGCEELGQIGIVGVVEHDKAGIDRLIATLARHDRARMSAQTRLGLEQGDVMRIGKVIGSAHARDSAADHGDPFRRNGRLFEWHRRCPLKSIEKRVN